MPSTMSSCMDAISASVGRRLVELSVMMLMKRMTIFLGLFFAGTAILSNGAEANRLESETFSGANNNRRALTSVATVGSKCVKLAHLDRRATGNDGLAPPLECLVHISGFQHPKAADVFLGLQVRPVRDEYPTTRLYP